jgi:hypothetical protein
LGETEVLGEDFLKEAYLAFFEAGLFRNLFDAEALLDHRPKPPYNGNGKKNSAEEQVHAASKPRLGNAMKKAGDPSGSNMLADFLAVQVKYSHAHHRSNLHKSHDTTGTGNNGIRDIARAIARTFTITFTFDLSRSQRTKPINLKPINNLPEGRQTCQEEKAPGNEKNGAWEMGAWGKMAFHPKS